MTVTVFTRAPGSIYANSTEALVAYLKLDVKVVYMDLTNLDPLFVEKFAPNNRFSPSLYDSENDLAINQQVAVNRYLLSLAKDKKNLLGKNAADEAKILQWSNRLDSGIIARLMPVIMRRFMQNPFTAEETAAFFKMFDTRAIDVLEEHLSKNKYLLGNDLTLADLEGAGVLSPLAMQDATPMPHLTDIVNNFGGNPEWCKAHPNTLRWLGDMQNSEPFKLQRAAPRQ